jgi:hypothetical protein
LSTKNKYDTANVESEMRYIVNAQKLVFKMAGKNGMSISLIRQNITVITCQKRLDVKEKTND